MDPYTSSEYKPCLKDSQNLLYIQVGIPRMDYRNTLLNTDKSQHLFVLYILHLSHTDSDCMDLKFRLE